MQNGTDPKAAARKAAARKAARARLARLDGEGAEKTRRKKNVLRTQATMGSKAARKAASTALSNMPRTPSKKK